ncbi:DUF4082 domain-containing protein [Kitasatospora sp. NPDC004289]
MTEVRVYSGFTGPANWANDGAAANDGISVGMEFRVSTTAWATKLWFWRANTDGDNNVRRGGIYRLSDGALLTPDTSFGVVGTLGAWNSVTLATPLALTTYDGTDATRYMAVIYHPGGGFTFTQNTMTADRTVGIITAPASGNAKYGSNTYRESPNTLSLPTDTFNSSRYWLDVSVDDTPPASPGRPVKVWSGSAWQTKTLKTWNGSAWVTKPTKVWGGSSWA